MPDQTAVERTEAERPEDKPAVTVHAVRSGWLGDFWERVKPLLESAIAEGAGEESLADVLELLSRRQYQLWVVLLEGQIGAAVVTTVVQKPRQKACRIVYLGGERLEEWAGALDETLCGWAKQLDCDVLEIWGRRGWAKTAKRLSAKQVLTVFQKVL